MVRKHARGLFLTQFQFGKIRNLNVGRTVHSVVPIRTLPTAQHGAAPNLRQSIRLSSSTNCESLDLLGEGMEFGHGPGHTCLFEKVDVVGNRE